MTFDEKLKMAAQFRSQGNPFAADPDRGWEKHIPAAREFLAELGIKAQTTAPLITGKRALLINYWDELDEEPSDVEEPEE